MNDKWTFDGRALGHKRWLHVAGKLIRMSTDRSKCLSLSRRPRRVVTATPPQVALRATAQTW